MTDENPFVKFWSAGFERLLPIVQPGAPISEKSSLAKRPHAVGKVPGVRRSDGEWMGFGWIKHVTTETDLAQWHLWGAGVGIRTGDGLVAVDIDTLDEDLAEQCHALADEMLGETCRRVGRAPKTLLLYRTNEPVDYRCVKFEGGLVELLSDGKQFVAHGIHPVTGKPYTWPEGVPKRDDLPVVTVEQAAKYFARLAAVLPKAEAVAVVSASSDRARKDQAQLRGDAETVRRAVEALPNAFDDRETYIQVGTALKAALPDDEDEALVLYLDWASRWAGGTNDPDEVEADWRRINPPFALGAQYLYHLAETHSAGQFKAAEAWFSDQPPASASPFDTAPGEAPAAAEPIKWMRPSEWAGREPPPRLWEVEGWIPRHEVTLLYGDGGIGKTLLAHQYATAAAAGLSWLGQPTSPARVMCFFCEDSEDELHRRQIDLCQAAGVELDAVDDSLRIASRKYMDNLLALWSRNNGAMQRTTVWQQLLEDALSFRATVIIVDTIADTFGGSEIDRAQVNAFIKSCLGRLGQETGASIIALAHPSVAGKSEGRSGSTAWSNAARSRLFLRYPKGVEKGNIRELEGMKLNYGPKGSLLKLQWRRGAFDVLSSSSQIDLNAFKRPDGVPDLEATVEALVLSAWSDAGDVELSLQARARSFAGRVLRDTGHEGLKAYSDDEIVSALRRLIQAGTIEAGDKGLLSRAAGGVFN